jgi:hypothetical protein
MNVKKAPTLLLMALLIAGPDMASARDDIGWLSGRWCSGDATNGIEEIWLPPVNGASIGLSWTIANGRIDGFEYIRIEIVDGIPTFLAQPGGHPPTPFRRTASGDGWMRFENPAHDFPRRIEYRRKGDALHAEIAGPGDNGSERVIPYDYRRCGV